jgi:hypothetical protein
MELGANYKRWYKTEVSEYENDSIERWTEQTRNGNNRIEERTHFKIAII